MPRHVCESVSATMTAQHDFGSTSVGLKTDLIDESTAAAGVSIDQVLCKDAAVTASGGFTGAVTGNVTGNLTGNVTVSSTIAPSSDDSVDLGDSTHQFKDGYIDGTLYTDAIDLNGTAITATGAELNILDGATVTAAELNQLDGKGAVIYDSTAGRVLRVSRLLISDATDANEIKCTLIDIHNGDTEGVTDNIGKGETVGNFSLNASGTQVTIENGAFTNTPVAIIGFTLAINATNTAMTCLAQLSGADIAIAFYNATSGAGVDITTGIDNGDIYVDVTYLTDA